MEKAGCLICGNELVYTQSSAVHTCALCGTEQSSSAACSAGHFVCDSCHGLPAFDWIERVCGSSTECDPFSLAIKLMDNPVVKMHGPEHHYLVPAVMLATFYNLRGEKGGLPKALSQARQRAEKVPGGVCGFCGNCGAAVGSGIFVAVVTGASPLSEEEWSLANRMTARSLLEVAEHGGPRCCKRDTFLSIRTAVEFSKVFLGVDYGPLEEPGCTFSHLNKQCREEQCPYYSPLERSDANS